MSKKRANLRPAVEIAAVDLPDVADFAFEAVDVAFMQFDAILEWPQAFENAGVIGFGSEAHVLLCRQLLFGGIELLLLLGELD